MSPRGRRILWGLIAAGVVIRVVVAFATVGLAYDIEAFMLVAGELRGSDPFALFDTLNGDVVRWAYPTGGFPFFLLADWFTVEGLLPFHGLIHLPGIAADAAIAWMVQAYLGDRGASERTRLLATALVALGPSFLVVNGYEGQLDTLAILPAVAGVLLWTRLEGNKRAPIVGALIGLGASIKSFPFMVVVALVPGVRRWRERIVLVGTAVAVPLLLLAPWLIATPGETEAALRYSGIPGIGGLSLLAQPGLAEPRLESKPFPPLTDLSSWLHDMSFVFLALGLAVAVLIVWRRQPDPALAVLIVWLAVYLTSVNFGPRYLVWALPFALMAGQLRQAAIIQAIGAPAAFLIARRWEADWISSAYVALMITLFLAVAAWFVSVVARPSAPRAAAEA